MGVVLSVTLLMFVPAIANDSPSDGGSNNGGGISFSDIDPIAALGMIVGALSTYALASKKSFREWQSEVEKQAIDRTNAANKQFDEYVKRLEAELKGVKEENREMVTKLAALEGKITVLLSERDSFKEKNGQLYTRNLELQSEVYRLRTGDDLGDSVG